jgi:DNA-binding CsgD family transcriptional regulator
MMFEREESRIGMAAVVVCLQVGAAVYFIADAWVERAEGGLAAVDFMVALALLGGAALGVVALRRFRAEARRKDEALAIARGALGALVTQRFAGWNLSKSEAEVALFALKGCTVAEIAQMRGSATGTVRSQLSQVYAKAGVTGQPMLMSLFLDDLIDGDMLTAE